MATNAQRRLAAREQEYNESRSNRQLAWWTLWTLFVFKMVTVGVIWYAATASNSHETAFIVSTTWYWFLIPIGAIAGPLLYRWRLLQMRRRRDELRGAEWMTHRRSDGERADVLTIEDLLYEESERRRGT
jgi:hypothetical protein